MLSCSSWSAHSWPLGRRVRRGLARFPSLCGTHGPLVPPWASKRAQAHLRLSDSMVLPLEPFLDTRLGQIATCTQKARCLLGQLSRRSITRGQVISSYHLPSASFDPVLEPSAGHLLAKDPLIWGHGFCTHRLTLESFPGEKVEADGAVVICVRNRCGPLGQARCLSRRSRARAWRLHCQSA